MPELTADVSQFDEAFVTVLRRICKLLK